MTVTSETKLSLLNAWATPFYKCDLNEALGNEAVSYWNSELRELILRAEAREEDPLLFGVTGATKTSLDILRWDTPAVEWLRKQIQSAVQDISASVGADTTTDADVDMIAEGWAVVYREGASHRLHTHHESAWSGTYYIDVGGVNQDAGHLQVIDPRPGAIARQASTGVESIEPRPGLLVCFPSWLPHSVKATAMAVGGKRICVAFNVGYEERVGNDH